MKAWKQIDITISDELECFIVKCFKRGEHNFDTLNGFAEGAESKILIDEIDSLINEYGDITIKRKDVLGD